MQANNSSTPHQSGKFYTANRNNCPATFNSTIRPAYTLSEQPLPLITSKFGNQQQSQSIDPKNATMLSSKPKLPTDSAITTPLENAQLEALLAKLTETSTSASLSTHTRSQNTTTDPHKNKDSCSSPEESHPNTPISTGHQNSPASQSTVESSAVNSNSEVAALRQQLAAAEEKIAHMDQELHQTRISNQIVDHAVNTTPEPKDSVEASIADQTINHYQSVLNMSSFPKTTAVSQWPSHYKTNFDQEVNKTGGLTNAQGPVWNKTTPTGLMSRINLSQEMQHPYIMPSWNNTGIKAWPGNTNPSNAVQTQDFGHPIPQMHRSASGFRVDPFHNPQHSFNDSIQLSLDGNGRRTVSNPPTRPGSAFERIPSWNSYVNGVSFTESANNANGHFPGHPLWQSTSHSSNLPTANNTRLSATAAEFTAENASYWNAQGTTDSSGGYQSPLEPMNYRRLLDKNMNCNWKYIVDKIVCNNDQQASIFLQQKLKVGTAEQKFEIVEAIIAQAYPLMINRFGNFLVQRCFEHGTTDQIISIANAIRGKTLQLSMDAFGCHVVQKAFDAVPEEYKAIMVHELLRRIPETVIHRYACHVWQKLFELRWSDSPPQIMKYVNEALRGMWHEVALGETGSLVVQNIFENCLEEDKRPCVDEVLASIDVISHGQFGNWCIQHICEHGAPADRRRALDHILRFATEYSMDQYASKVIEKCLKIGGSDFLDRYLDRVCEGRSDRPRMPLIDIAGDQFGNYLIQWILTNASPQHREIVAAQVRKHMVSLRGSKYGSRVAMLCCNPAIATRPGPPANIPLGRFGNNGVGRGNFAGFR